MPNSTPKHPSELSPVQLNAAELLATGLGVVKVAELLNLNRHTVTRWRTRNPFFIAAVNSTRKELWSEAQERLRGMVNKAIDVMEASLDDGDSRCAVEVLKSVGLYGNIGRPRGSANADEIMADMAEGYAKELLFTRPSSDPSSRLQYATQMLPVITAEIYDEMKDDINIFIGEDDVEESANTQ